MAWPASQDYNEAIQNPASAFSDSELSRGQPAVNALGLPMPRSGNFADVYEIRTNGRKWAVKCFTREVHGLRERYYEISIYLRRQQLPFMVDFQYLDQGIRVRGQWYPVLKMHWVEGLTLNEFVRLALEKPGWLDTLAQIWVRMARKLRDSHITHGDLQHGNILLVHGSKASALAVKLIDYDGMLVPRLAQKPSGEVGHPAYQHPERLRTGLYCPEVDRFPNLVIFCALRALLVGGRPLWDRYDNGDNLLFRQKDFDEPDTSPLFQELLQLPDLQVRQLTMHIRQALQRPLRQTPWLEDILPRVATGRPVAKANGIAAAPAVWSVPERDTAEDVFADAVTGAPRLTQRSRPRNRSWLWGVVGVSLALATAIPGALWLAGMIPARQRTNVAEVQPKHSEPLFGRTPERKDITKPPVQPATVPSAPPLNSNLATAEAAPTERSTVSRTRLDPAFAGEYPGLLTGLFHEERSDDMLVGLVVATDHNPPSEPVYIAGVAPLYAHAQPATPLRWYGRQTADQYPLKAPVGYALGGFQARGGRHLTAIRAIFEAVDHGHLNARGVLMSREIGLPPSKTDRTITKQSPIWPVVGLHGNADNGIGRLGLIFRQERARPSQQARRQADSQVQQFVADNKARLLTDGSQSLAAHVMDQGLHARVPALRYEFLVTASQEAARQGDLNTALAAANQLGFDFDISRPPLERQLLEQVWQKLQTQGNGRQNQQQVNRLCVVINQKIREALDLHDVLSAHELAVLGEKAAPRASANRIWKPLMANMRRELDQALRNALPSLTVSAPGTPTTTESPSPPRNSIATSARQTDSRLPVPGEKERMKILADLHQRYAQRYDSPDPHQRAALAQEFLRQGGDEATEQVSRYVLLQEAGQLAAGAESLSTALEAINHLGANYAVNALQLKTSLVEAAAAGLRRPSRALVFVPLAATVAEELIAADRYEDAARALAATEKGAHLVGQPATLRLVAAQHEFVQQLAAEWENLKPARNMLRQAPTDPVANQAVGRFHCLAKGDWGAGLELLVRGNGGDLALQNAAKQDLSRPDKGSTRRELADTYRRLSEQADGLAKLQLARRAVHWYRAALLSDLSSTQAQQTREEMHRLERLPGFRPPQVPGSFRRLPHSEESLTCLAVTPDGLTLATGATGEPVRLYDAESGRKQREIQRARGFSLSGLAFNSTGQKILAYDSRGVLDVWDSQSGARDTAFRPTIGPLKHAVWAGSDTLITAGTSTWFQRLAADGSNEIKRVPNRTGNISCLTGSADAKWIALGTTEGVVEVYTAAQPTLIVALPHPRGAAQALAFTPDGKHLVAAYADRAIVRWDVKRSSRAQLLARSTTPVEQLAVSADGRRIIWTSGDRLLHYADGHSRKESLRLDSLGKPIKGIAWMPDGQHAISADEDGTILLWSLPGD